MKFIYLIILLFTMLFLFSCNKESSNPTSPGSIGSIIIKSSPSGAKILLAGDETNKLTPDTLSLLNGSYLITLQLENFTDTSFYVNVKSDTIISHYIFLHFSLVIPDSIISYMRHIQPLFSAMCASFGCHDDTTSAGGVSLTSCINTKSNPSIVFPGEPDNSRLIWAIEGIGNYPMPPIGYGVLTTNQIKGVRTWVKEGAECN